MKEMDGRKLRLAVLEEIRIRAVKPVEAGESPEVVINAQGFHRPAIYKQISIYRGRGIEALKARKVADRRQSSTANSYASCT